jgi:hypothetical protein
MNFGLIELFKLNRLEKCYRVLLHLGCLPVEPI